MPKDKRLNYVENETILCYHGPLLYEAKVMKAEYWEHDGKKESEHVGPHYFIHYKGWNVKWDDWVPESRTLKWTPENLRKQAELEETVSPTGRRSSVRVPERGKRSSLDMRKRRRDSVLKSPDEPDILSGLPSFKLALSDHLKDYLAQDYRYIVHNQGLVPLPRTPSVKTLLTDYLSHMSTSPQSEQDETKTVVDGLTLYFNTGLKNILLYRSERPQFAGLVKRLPKMEPCDVYGAEHLLRLFVRLPVLVARVGADEETLDLFKTAIYRDINVYR
ncbi:uncharacterized protein SPPG_06345 [Spizellomyces punctatus DAOM BR117]|uniref:Chromatin modification-related protein EAF3 n=1 Tax=Spizellomyces punctatus (strain DAOM BR117) TaxID=645134 RepID=A0A0L0HCP3_SPIPD|nr:uncharacterized protein SPPG_06345 [Spizellomyces punctatus DAOM BR117]KNC98664.1 hypothetical protein SPPG_06345 [Spizellomyces punctatus DAOM BR117]|eukprot:XP_016606704.1 hypothetical protein SPPG_06345 [Spizellomyces punctatus DAOM BR117]